MTDAAAPNPALVIAGSVRAGRLCLQIADWVAALGREASASLEVVDLKAWPLPMDDEAGVPATGVYAYEHTRAWSRKIAAAPAFVFVTPQYNWGYPAALKNALDHLYTEWSGKPAMIVSYGGHGGGRCAEQLAQVLQGLHMKSLATQPQLTLPRTMIEANIGEIDPGVVFSAHRDALGQAFSELNAMAPVVSV